MLVQLHIYPLSAKRNTLSLQPKPLLKRIFASQLDRAPSSQHALPRHPKGATQRSRSLPSAVRNACRSCNCAVGADFSARNLPNQRLQSTLRVQLHLLPNFLDLRFILNSLAFLAKLPTASRIILGLHELSSSSP